MKDNILPMLYTRCLAFLNINKRRERYKKMYQNKIELPGADRSHL